MTYADSMLTSGETVILRQKQHWLALILDSRIALALWIIAIVAIVLRVFFSIGGTLGQIIDWASIAAVVAGVIVVIYRWLKWRTEEYLVTTRRLLNVSGVVNKRSADSSLEKINDAVLQVNLLGRMLDYGDLDILTAADSGIDRYRMLNHATAFKKAMLSAKHALDSDTDGARTGRPTVSPQASMAGGEDPMRADTPEEVSEVLGRLATMRDAGQISAEEYEAKKQELLGRL